MNTNSMPANSVLVIIPICCIPIVCPMGSIRLNRMATVQNTLFSHLFLKMMFEMSYSKRTIGIRWRSISIRIPTLK